MTLPSIIVLAVLVGLLALAVTYVVRRRAKGGCAGGCPGSCAGCAHAKQHNHGV